MIRLAPARATRICLFAAAAAAIGGCENADSANGVTQADLAALQAEVSTLRAEAAATAAGLAATNTALSATNAALADTANAATRDRLLVSGVPGSVLKRMGKANGEALEFTVLGPRGGSIVGADALEVAGSNGYLAVIPVSGSDVAVEEAPAVWYESANCTGPGWLLALPGSFQYVSAFNAEQGLVMRDGADPATATYLMLRAGTQAQQVNLHSRRIGTWVPNSTIGGQCDGTVDGSLARPAYATETNDLEESGIPSGVFGTSAKLVPELPMPEGR